MGIRISISDSKVKGTEPVETEVVVHVDNKGGGGGSIQCDIESIFPTADFTYVTDSADPVPDSISGGDLSWKDRKVLDEGTDFKYRITCNTGSQGGLVTAQACLAGSTTECASASKTVLCS